MRLLCIDFETTWTTPVNPKECRIREIGAVLYEWDEHKTLVMLSDFVHEEDHPASPKELVDLTGITDEMTKEFGIPLREALLKLSTVMERADYIVAHNGNVFDRVVLESEAARIGFVLPEKPWVDTKTDVEYPPRMKSTSLAYLCTAHEFLNPFAHRALFDALATLKVLKNYDLARVLELSREPTVKAVAEVRFSEKHLAKDRGYYWDGEEKHWFKDMKEKRAEQEKLDAPFNVRIIRSL